MKRQSGTNAGKLMRTEPKVRRAMQDGIRKARERRRALGFPVAEWRDGKVVWIPAVQVADALPAEHVPSRNRAVRKPRTSASKCPSNRAKGTSRSKAS